jgi:hypothetical protein
MPSVKYEKPRQRPIAGGSGHYRSTRINDAIAARNLATARSHFSNGVAFCLLTAPTSLPRLTPSFAARAKWTEKGNSLHFQHSKEPPRHA